MGISRDSLHKRRATGGRKKHWRKKKKYEMGRQASNTKLSVNVAVRKVRVRGGNYKFRALRLDSGSYSWGSEAVSRKTRILDVVYNASNNELVRTQTLVKNAIVQVDATPFKTWYQTHYGVELGGKGKIEEPKLEDKKASNHVKRKLKSRLQTRKLDAHLTEQFSTGRLYACIASRPGQAGRCDGYILEGKELEFYLKKLQKKKSGGKA
ncbi:ribosomal protein S8e/ribosomal biogenesis NSA2 [Haematococcus lacustris]